MGTDFQNTDFHGPDPQGAEPQEDRADDLRGLPLGTILYRQGLVQQDELEGALVEGMESGELLGEILIRRGLLSRDDIARALAAQQGQPLPWQEEPELDGGILAVHPADPSFTEHDALERELSEVEAVPSQDGLEDLLLPGYHMSGDDEQVIGQEQPTDEAAEQPYEDKKDQVEQTWPDTQVEETAPAWSAPNPLHEAWHEPEADVAADEPAPVERAEVSELDAQHEANVGRIEDLLARIDQGASTFADLRARIGGLSQSLHTAEETIAERDRRLAELTGAHEAGERRIEELVAQLHEREEELHGVGGRLDELSGRLVSAEERADERERRLEELFRQVERRDNALSALESKLDGIAARFAAEAHA
ncbi:MAG TPA: hypothetical protein VGQ38_03465 [Gaiellaceae bacterium]|nr:hypothetical protein [Gaiellaceae bacterium]